MAFELGTTLPYRSACVVVAAFAVAALVFEASPLVWIMLLTISGLLAVFPGFLTWYLINRTISPQMSSMYNVRELRITPIALIPAAVFFAVGIAVTDQFLLSSSIFLLGLLSLSILSYHTTLNTRAARRSMQYILILAVTTLPVILTAGNLIILSTVISSAPLPSRLPLVLVLVMNTMLVLTAYLLLCSTMYNHADLVPTNPIDSKWARFSWVLILGVLNGSILAILGLFVASNRPSTWTSVTTEAFSGTSNTAAEILGYVSVLVLVSPVLLVISLWIVHLVRMLAEQRWILRHSRPIGVTTDGIPIREISHPPFAIRATRIITRGQAIIIGSRVRNELTATEIQAVLEHELFHLRHRDPLRLLIGSCCGILIGGRSAFVAMFDFPSIEQRADEYAAEKTSPSAVIAALRTLELVQKNPDYNMTADPHFLSAELIRNPKQLLEDTYSVLFGSIVIGQAHASVDERIRNVSHMDYHSDAIEQS